MYLTVKEKKELVVKKSRNGKGVFTKKAFGPEKVVLKVIGTYMTCDEEDDVDEETRSNTYRYDSNGYISPTGRLGDYINHSCYPNVKIVKKENVLFLVTIDSVAKGKEILLDYSTILASDDSWTMKCNCGSENCRGVIKNFTSLPKKIKQNYIAEKIIPSYILSL